jgi:ribosomal subunit interface protein
MEKPLQITFRNMDPSDVVRAKVEERAEKLEKFHDHIMGCHVVIEAPHKHHRKGKLYWVRIDITVPDGELVVNRNPSRRSSHEDVYVTIRDAFNAARRRLEDHVRKHRPRDVKHHETPPHGQVSELHPTMDYGRIATSDGRSIYFHRNSILNAEFDELVVGTEVRFAEGQGDQGPKATSVSVIGKHHLD